VGMTEVLPLRFAQGQDDEVLPLRFAQGQDDVLLDSTHFFVSSASIVVLAARSIVIS